jgi:hypothetical protein
MPTIAMFLMTALVRQVSHRMVEVLVVSTFRHRRLLTTEASLASSTIATALSSRR